MTHVASCLQARPMSARITSRPQNQLLGHMPVLVLHVPVACFNGSADLICQIMIALVICRHHQGMFGQGFSHHKIL